MAGIEALLRGRVLNERYRIEEVIGRGGMGAVYRASDEKLGRRVAVKVITASTGGDAELRERVRARFHREAQAAGKLPHHPNVVPVYDYGTDAELGLDYIVMELLRGEDLASRLQRTGPPPLGEALTILRDAARGINVGHRSGLIHRDVKPGNIFLVEEAHGERQIRVLDFGIAKAMADEDTQTALTQDGRAPLSPAYASPEQLAGEARLTPASDVFGLGAVAFQMVTGEKPFTEADRNRMAVGMEVPVPSVRARNAAVPAPVEMVVRRALAYRAEDRFATAGAFADAIDVVLRDVGSTAAASVVPAVAGPIVTDDADDDRTALAGDDRTMLATPRGPSAGIPAGAAAVGASAAAGERAGAPAIPAPRRRAEPARRGVNPLVWVLLLLALGAAGYFAMQSMNGGRRGSGDPLAGLPDSARVDSTAQGDTLTAEDAPRLDRAGLALMNTDPAAAADSFRLAIELLPDQVRFRDHLAYAYLRQQRFAEAAQVLEEAIRVDGSYDLLYSHLADAREGLGDTQGAIRALERFVSVTLDEEDRTAAEGRLARLRATLPPAQPADTIQLGPPPAPPPVDTLPSEPADTIRLP